MASNYLASYQPKGFRKYAETATPIKDGSAYTSGTHKERIKSVGSGSFDSWILYQNQRYGGNGKDFYLDFACFGGPTYFDYTGSTSVKIDVRFYSIVTGQWGNWGRLGDYRINVTSGGLPSSKNNYEGIAKLLWDNYYNYGSYKPAFGYVSNNKGINASSMSYRDYVLACLKAEPPQKPHEWDARQGVYAFAGVMPFGVRYISNNGKWSSSRNNVNPDGYVGRSWRAVNTMSWSAANEDGGNTPSSLKHFILDENLINNINGTSTGVTDFQLRFTIYKEDIFYFPQGGFSDWTKIDNPRLGLLDYGPRNAGTDWPPRYDAKVYRCLGGGNNPELQAQHCSPGGSWGLF